MPAPRFLVRQLRSLAPFVVVASLLLFLYESWDHGGRLTLDQAAVDKLLVADRNVVVEEYDRTRLAAIAAARFKPKSAARSLNMPETFADGSSTLNPDVKAYAARLLAFISAYLPRATGRVETEDAIHRLAAADPPTPSHFAPNLFSTHVGGEDAVPDSFQLWRALLPVALPPELAETFPEEEEWTEIAHKGVQWWVDVADDAGIDLAVLRWLKHNPDDKAGPWATVWDELGYGPLQVDLYSYMAMLFEGGIYADADTVPIAHPYLWGIDARDIVHPDLRALGAVREVHDQAVVIDEAPNRVWERRSLPREGGDSGSRLASDEQATGVVHAAGLKGPEVGAEVSAPAAAPASASSGEPQWVAWQPPYPGAHRSSDTPRLERRTVQPRAPMSESIDTPESPVLARMDSLLSPGVNVVFALEWDKSLMLRWSHWPRWSFARLKRTFYGGKAGRTLQVSHTVLAAKPHHPIFVDALATAVELLEAGGADRLPEVDVTGSGPLTDAVLRYLLVRYGVTPNELRGIKRAVRIGDVLILPEQAFSAPPIAYSRLVSHVQRFFPSLPGSGLATYVRGHSLWPFGAGYENWRRGGLRVVYHAYAGEHWREADVNGAGMVVEA